MSDENTHDDHDVEAGVKYDYLVTDIAAIVLSEEELEERVEALIMASEEHLTFLQSGITLPEMTQRRDSIAASIVASHRALRQTLATVAEEMRATIPNVRRIRAVLAELEEGEDVEIRHTYAAAYEFTAELEESED